MTNTDRLAEYEALRDRLRKKAGLVTTPCDAGRAADAIDALLRRLELESQTLRDTMASYERLDQEHEALEAQVRALTRERESDYAQALAHRKGLTAKLQMAESEVARLTRELDELRSVTLPQDCDQKIAKTDDDSLKKSAAVCRLNAQSAKNAHVAMTQLAIAASIDALRIERDEARAELARLTRERDEARKFGEEAARRYNDLLAEGLTLRCAFCNAEYPKGTQPTQHEALTAHVKVCEKHPLRAELDEVRASLALHCSCDEDAPHKPDCIVVLRDTMRGMEEEIEERAHERDVARDETRIVEEGRAAWEREYIEARAALERLRAAVEHLCGQICTAFRPYGRHAPECLAYELQPDEQARSAEQHTSDTSPEADTK